MKVCVHPRLLKFPNGKDLIDILSLGTDVIVSDDAPAGCVVYLGYYPDELREEDKKAALPLVGDEVSAMHSLLLNFALGYIPTEIRAFKGEEDDIVSEMRVR